jgi:hypothetical protein
MMLFIGFLLQWDLIQRPRFKPSSVWCDADTYHAAKKSPASG